MAYGDPVHVPSEVKAAVNAGMLASGGTPIVPGRAHAFVVPEGAELTVESLEEFEQQPWRKRGVSQVHDLESLQTYVNVHVSGPEEAESRTSVWVDEHQRRITGVLDDHGDQPGFGEHRVALQLRATPEWDHWMKLDGQLLTQVAFAEHVEDGLGEIVNPAAAEMLEIAQSFHAHTEAQFRSGNRLSSGETRFLYDEEVSASAGRTGELVVPTDFEIALSPFMGEEPYRVKARLRYRVSSGGLKIGYRLDRPHVVVHDAIESMQGRLIDGAAPGVTVYRGSPRGDY